MVSIPILKKRITNTIDMTQMIYSKNEKPGDITEQLALLILIQSSVVMSQCHLHVDHDLPGSKKPWIFYQLRFIFLFCLCTKDSRLQIPLHMEIRR